MPFEKKKNNKIIKRTEHARIFKGDQSAQMRMSHL